MLQYVRCRQWACLLGDAVTWITSDFTDIEEEWKNSGNSVFYYRNDEQKITRTKCRIYWGGKKTRMINYKPGEFSPKAILKCFTLSVFRSMSGLKHFCLTSVQIHRSISHWLTAALLFLLHCYGLHHGRWVFIGNLLEEKVYVQSFIIKLAIIMNYRWYGASHVILTQQHFEMWCELIGCGVYLATPIF